MMRIVLLLIIVLYLVPLFAKDYRQTENIINLILKESMQEKKETSKSISQKETAIDKKSQVIKDTKKSDSAGAFSSADGILLKTAIQLYNSSMYKPSEEKLKKILADFPTSPIADNARIWLGRIYLNTHRYKMAQEELNKVNASSGERPSARYIIAQSYKLTGFPTKAIEEYKKVASLYQQHELADNALLETAGIYFFQKRGPQALETLVSLIKVYNTRETIDDAYYLLGQIYEVDVTLRDPEIAQQIYRIFLKKAKSGKKHFVDSPLLTQVEKHLNNLNKEFSSSGS